MVIIQRSIKDYEKWVTHDVILVHLIMVGPLTDLATSLC